MMAPGFTTPVEVVIDRRGCDRYIHGSEYRWADVGPLRDTSR